MRSGEKSHKVECGSENMELRLGPTPRAHILLGSEAGPRAFFGQAVGQAIDRAKGQAKDRVPQAEAAAARYVERTRPVWSWLVLEWRRLGTVAAVVLIIGLLLHAMLGANGMVIYRQKRAEMQALKNEVEFLKQENTRFVDQIKALKSDPAAIEKEAREQLHYTRPGEVVLVAPDPPSLKSPSGRAGNDQ